MSDPASRRRDAFTQPRGPPIWPSLYSRVTSALCRISGLNSEGDFPLHSLPPLSGFLVDERRRIDEEEEGLRDERLLEVEADLKVRLEEQLLPHVGDRRRSRPVTGVSERRRRFVVMIVVVEAVGTDLSPDSVQVVQLWRREEVEEAVPLGPLRHHISVSASLSNYKASIITYDPCFFLKYLKYCILAFYITWGGGHLEFDPELQQTWPRQNQTHFRVESASSNCLTGPEGGVFALFPRDFAPSTSDDFGAVECEWFGGVRLAPHVVVLGEGAVE